ncbi:IWS1-like protein [Anopheles bellator]|uniref:IWS1-like protein n=1 Tax=Anopheles bellator TaxID=139047 RepID=UPI002649DFCD|nr:IWS1-like protein [Anopheles bellator]
MKYAASCDHQLRLAGQLATNKIRLLNNAMEKLKKPNGRTIFLEHGLLRVLALWLAPSHDGDLPLLQIRQEILNLLYFEYSSIRSAHLKGSGLGQRIFELARNQEETSKNRKLAKALTARWAREVFKIPTDYADISCAERSQIDLERAMQSVQQRPIAKPKEPVRSFLPFGMDGQQKSSLAATKDNCLRTRVPMVSMKDYVVRPRSERVAEDANRTKETWNDKFVKNFLKRKMANRSEPNRMLNISNASNAF